MLLDAVLPAGGLISGSFAREAGVTAKAMIQLGRWTMLERTLATLRATERIGRTVVIGPEEVTSHAGALSADAALLAGTSGAANIFRGLEWLYAAHGRRYPDRVLILATDLPFLTPEAVAGFLDSCPADLDLCLPVFERGEFERRFPRVPAPYVRLRDGEWIIGCAVLVDPRAIVRNRRAIEQAFATRRDRLAMARALGVPFLVQFVLRRLTVPRIEQRCLEVLGCTGRAIRGCAAELAFDIDYVENYRYAVCRAA